jgi:aspartate/methionine/tyrosine aminotransferase
VSRLHRPTVIDNIAVTSSGMSALMLVTQALVAPGDRVVAVTPLWPNLVEIPKILGAEVDCVALRLKEKRWTLDLDELLAALTPGTRAAYINSPNNPTGWTLDRESQRAILEHCRRHGIWIIADDPYERLYYEDTGIAPSFLDIADARDRVISTNTFSKSWLMTGWRLGWIVTPRELIADFGTLIEYNTSCAPGFVQRAGLVAVTQGEPVIARTLARFRSARDFLIGRLNVIDGIEAPTPPGTMYAFFRVRGMTDSLAFCKRLVTEAGLGLAPGSAFGREGEGCVRWCFAADETRLAEGAARLERFLLKRQA